MSAAEIFVLIREKPNSIIAPYLIEYISDLEKEQGDRLNFYEFTRSIAKYCLLTPSQLLQCKRYSVVFKCIDQNDNGHVNKEEILLFLKADWEGKQIFPPNYMKAVELYETKDDYLIDFGALYSDEFVRLVQQVPYLSFPAFRLQKSLRNYTLGVRKWKTIGKRLVKRTEHEKQRQVRSVEIANIIKKKKWEVLDFSADSDRSYNVRPRSQPRRTMKRTSSLTR